MAQMVKRLPAMREIQVRFLGWEDPWRRKWQSTPALLPGKSHGWRSLIGYTVHGVTKSRTRLSDLTFTLDSEGLADFTATDILTDVLVT